MLALLKRLFGPAQEIGPLPPRVLALLQEVERRGRIDERDPITQRSEFEQAEDANLIMSDGGWGFSFVLSPKGKRALALVHPRGGGEVFGP